MIFANFMIKTVLPVRILRRKCSNKCIVYSTNVTNPYQNLAFEDWMHEKVNFNEADCLFIWRNLPTVVIGRHQNPWKECDVTELQRNGVNLCRRKSGGGAVYHDLGNVNFTFFTKRKSYNRKRNLNFIISGLKAKWPELNVSLNKRDDIILENKFKISGSSAKLGRNNAYHHCTLLINACKENLSKYLAVDESKITCNATSSIRSRVLNLADVDETINYADVCDAVSSSYTQHHASCDQFVINTNDENFLPGISELTQELQSWEWIFGKTPDLLVKKSFESPDFGVMFIEITIKKGLIAGISFSGSLDEAITDKIKSKCLDVRFSFEDLQAALACVVDSSIEGPQTFDFICKSILKFVE